MHLTRPLAASILACSAEFFPTANAFAVPWASIQPRAPPAASASVVDDVPTPARPEDQRTAIVTLIGGIRGKHQQDAVSTSAAAVISAVPTTLATVVEVVPSPPRPEDQRTAVATIIGGIRGHQQDEDEDEYEYEDEDEATPVSDVLEAASTSLANTVRPEDQRTAVVTLLGAIHPRPIPLVPLPPPPTPTPTPTPEPVLTDPMDPPGAKICEPSPKEQYLDAHEWPLMTAAEYFCKEWASPKGEHNPDTMLPIQRSVFNWNEDFGAYEMVRHHENIEWKDGYLIYKTPSLQYYGTEKSDDIYNFTISRVLGCALRPGQRWNFTEPLKGEMCDQLLPRAWKECNNQGRGGSIQAGCLRYQTVTLF